MIKRKGIILAGGTGTRLYPSTISISKQLMPVYDKPMIYYPLSVLMKAGIREIMIITADNKIIAIEEKPEHPKSNYAITGLYLYDGQAPKYAKTIKPSKRGELEITSLNQIYLDRGELNCVLLGEGTSWLDTGTHRSLLRAAEFVHLMEERQGRRICCPEVIAYRQGWISKTDILKLAEPLKKSGYGDYILKIANS